MRELTQTVTGLAGNCWQTCIACLLDVDADVLPSQCEYDWKREKPDGSIERGPRYSNALGSYLRKHHRLAYAEPQFPEEFLTTIRVADPGWHVITGTSVVYG